MYRPGSQADYGGPAYSVEISLANDVDELIGTEIKKFIFQIVLNCKIRFGGKIGRRHRLRSAIHPEGIDLYPILELKKDKRFIELLQQIKKEFDDGYQVFTE